MKTKIVMRIAVMGSLLMGCATQTKTHSERYLVEGVLVQGAPEQCREVMSSFATNTLERFFACCTGKVARLVYAPPVKLSVGEYKSVTNYSAFVESGEMMENGSVKKFVRTGIGECLGVRLLQKNDDRSIDAEIDFKSVSPPNWKEYRVGIHTIYMPLFHAVSIKTQAKFTIGKVEQFGQSVINGEEQTVLFKVTRTKFEPEP